MRICEEKSGLYSSLFWTIALGSQIFAYLFNSLILGLFQPYVLFLLATIISMVSLVIFGLLKDPDMPPGYEAQIENSAENFKLLLRMTTDRRVTRMYGLFVNSACAAATAQGLLIPFFCLILKHEPIQE